MDQKNSSPLPPLYAGWLDDLLGGDIPNETRATCNDCAMCDSSAKDPKDAARFFNPQSKCCTYIPVLPNYLVGMILADDDPAMAAGRATVEKRIAAGLAITPSGLEWPLKSRAQYTQMESYAFGRAQSLRCPHFLNEQGGLCGIWKYRNSICSTWFCKYVRGAVGRNFWESTKQLLLTIEQGLSRWCAVKLELDDSALRYLLTPMLMPGQLPDLKLEDIDERVDFEKQRRIWANWHGREREFYLACGELVASLEWSDVSSICGAEVQLRSRLTQQAYRAVIGKDIPERLKVGAFTVMQAGRDFYKLHRPGIGLDVFPLSARVTRLLPYFDGRPTTEVVSEIVDKEGLRFTDDLLRRLVDFKILESVAEDIPRLCHTLTSPTHQPAKLGKHRLGNASGNALRGLIT